MRVDVNFVAFQALLKTERFVIHVMPTAVFKEPVNLMLQREFKHNVT
jgi:hypothetical protein